MRIKNIILIILGTIILAFGNAVFIIPFNIVFGGVTGVSIVLNKLFSLPYLSVNLFIAVLTWAMFFVGLFVLGRSFALKTLISTLIYPIAISVFSFLTKEGVLGGFFRLSDYGQGELSFLLATLFGSVFVGAGCALTFLGGGSTGGVDILAFIICKHFKRAKSSYVIFILDAVIIAFAMLILRDLVLSLLGILSAFIAALVIDKLFLGEISAFTAQIVSNSCGEINSAIIKNLKRTSTYFDVTGGYLKDHKQMLTVSFPREQYVELIDIVTKIDSGAFIMVHKAHEIRGHGWKK